MSRRPRARTSKDSKRLPVELEADVVILCEGSPDRECVFVEVDAGVVVICVGAPDTERVSVEVDVEEGPPVLSGASDKTKGFLSYNA